MKKIQLFLKKKDFLDKCCIIKKSFIFDKICYTIQRYFDQRLLQLNNFFLYESNGRDLIGYRKEAEGARCRLHLNSQAKGPLPDRTLESFLINTEGVISHIMEKSLR